MKAALAILWHSLRRVRNLVVGVGVLLGLFQIVMIFVARTLENSGQFSQLAALLPPFVRALLGPSMTAFLSFAGIVSLGYFEPAVLGAVIGVAMAVGTRLTLEIESGFIDVILARPVARHWMVTRSVVVALVSVGVMIALMLVGTRSGLALLAPMTSVWPTRGLIVGLAVNLGLLGLCWSAIALAIAAGSRRRGTAGAWGALLALVAFLTDYVARLWEPAKALARFSPFAYFSPLDLVMGGEFPIRSVWVLLAMTIGGFAVAYVLFLRRDIAR
jgi:ABC-2 type transport system permease protein